MEDPARGLLYAFWTQGSFEAANDEHVVFSKSADGGKTWTDPVTIAGSETLAHPVPVAAWQQPMLTRSGRLYCLWNQETTVKKHLCGIMQGRYSDDAGESWSEIGTVPFPIRFSSDPDDPTVPPSWCMWQRPLRFGEDGRYLAGCSRYSYKTQGRESSKVEFWQYDNIDDDPEIEDIRISFFNTEDESFDAATVETDEHFTGREIPSVEEACIVGLPDGRLFVRTYERGVEDETWACGTGVTACALVTGIGKITARGGSFEVDYQSDPDAYTHIRLTGPVSYNFKGTITLP